MNIQLLVSVRNSEEARIAAKANVDIIDVKDPDNGPLGFAGFDKIETIQSQFPETCLSAAFGELRDWKFQSHQLPRPLAFAKFGLAHAGNDWVQLWHDVTAQLTVHVQQWVAVAYADYALANSPTPEEILDQTKTTAAVLLIDTYEKNGTNCIQCLSQERIKKLQQLSAAAGMKLALAGQLCNKDVPTVRAMQVDILGVRGAVCSHGNRTSTVELTKIVALKNCLQSQ